MEEECKTDEDLSEHLEKIQDLITDLKECPRSSFCLLKKLSGVGMLTTFCLAENDHQWVLQLPLVATAW